MGIGFGSLIAADVTEFRVAFLQRRRSQALPRLRSFGHEAGIGIGDWAII
jgi:hypothetical protein